MNIVEIARTVTKVAELLMDVMDADRQREYAPYQISETVRCADCDAEAWQIRWGAIRVGQELRDFYAQSSVNGPPVILCRACWHKRLGVDDTLTP